MQACSISATPYLHEKRNHARSPCGGILPWHRFARADLAATVRCGNRTCRQVGEIVGLAIWGSSITDRTLPCEKSGRSCVMESGTRS